LNYTFIKAIESSNIKAYFIKKHQIWADQFREPNTYDTRFI